MWTEILNLLYVMKVITTEVSITKRVFRYPSADTLVFHCIPQIGWFSLALHTIVLLEDVERSVCPVMASSAEKSAESTLKHPHFCRLRHKIDIITPKRRTYTTTRDYQVQFRTIKRRGWPSLASTKRPLNSGAFTSFYAQRQLISRIYVATPNFSLRFAVDTSI